MSRGSPSSAVCRARSGGRIHGPLPGDASVSGRLSDDPITCSRTALAMQGERNRQGNVLRYCRRTGADAKVPESIGDTHRVPAAPSDGRKRPRPDGRRTPGTGSCGSSAPSRNRLRRVRQAGHAGQFAVAGALSRHRLLRPHTVRPLRSAGPRLCPRGGHQLRRRVIARHPRSYDQGDYRLRSDPLSVLAGAQDQRALDQAAPLGRLAVAAGCSAILRRLLEARMGKAGKREYVQVLRLVESFDPSTMLRRRHEGRAARRDRLRCGQAPGAVPDREAPAHA